MQSNRLEYIDFENKSYEQRLKDMLKEKSYEHYYQVQWLTPKYDKNELLRLKKTYSQFDTFEVTREIVQRHFYKEFYEGAFANYSHDQKKSFIESLEAYVSERFGKDSDLTKTARYFQLVFLYQQNKFDEKLFYEWVKNYHYSHSVFVYDTYHSYNSPWNAVLQSLSGSVNPTDGNLVEKVIEANLEH